MATRCPLESYWSQYVSWFGGAWRFHPLLLTLNVVLLAGFAWDCHRTYRSTGWRVDFWMITLGLQFVVPVLVLYPFNGSYLNFISVGERYLSFDRWVSYAYLITVTGFGCVYLGRGLYRWLGVALPLRLLHLTLERLFENNIKRGLTTYLLVVVTLLLLYFVVQIQVTTGHLFDPRAYFQMHGLWRPFYNLLLVLYPLALVFVGLRLMQWRGRHALVTLADVVGLLLLLAGVPFLGTRGVVLYPLLTLLTFLSFRYRRQVRWGHLGGVTVLLLLLAILLLGLRSGEVGATLGNLGNEIFYGNTFSDTRDFAWVLSFWPGQWLEGKTYLAGLMAFVPREFSDFRNTWGLGIFTTTTLGMHPAIHPGVRPGTFGEVYFNFGLPGVVVLGTGLGYVLAYVNQAIRRVMEHSGDVVHAYAHTLSWTLALCFSISLGFAGFYAVVLVTLALALLRQLCSPATPHVMHRP